MLGQRVYNCATWKQWQITCGFLAEHTVKAQSSAADVGCNNFVDGVDKADAAESHKDKGIVCDVQGFVSNELDGKSEETTKLIQPAVSGSTTVKHIVPLKQLVCREALSDDQMSALNNLETTIVGSALNKQSKFTGYFGKQRAFAILLAYSCITTHYEWSAITNASYVTMMFI